MANRRSFLKNSSLLTLSLPFMGELLSGTGDKHLSAVGIQLYMMRDEMKRDPVNTLKQLGKLGYTQIESYNGDKGVFWGYTGKEFKRIAGDSGLTLISTHYEGDSKGYEKTAAEAAEIGMKYLIYPWKGPQKSIEDFKKIANEFNGYGAICKKHGIKFAYHPHDYAYKKIDGEIPLDVLLKNTDPALVDFQMDFYYAVTEGQDPAAYLKKYKPRFRLSHLRDVMKERLPAGSDEESACDLGQGIMNYSSLLALAIKNGMQYFFVEQSRLFQETAMQSAQYNASYLKKLRLT